MEPKIIKSELTGQWYVITRYSIRPGIDSDHGVLVAHKKYDVTGQMEIILRNETKRKPKSSARVL